MARTHPILMAGAWSLVSASLLLTLFSHTASASLLPNYYTNICPKVESIVRDAVVAKFQQTFVTIPGTIRLFFHDCCVQGCDASIMLASTETNKAEKESPDNLSLAGDGFDTVIKAKEAVDAVDGCKDKVSCADILAMATRDAIVLAGGPSYTVELGRLDGLSSTLASVKGKLPQPNFNLNKLNKLFAAIGLSQEDMIALSGYYSFGYDVPRQHTAYDAAPSVFTAAHTLGFSHCNRFANRIRNFSKQTQVDPTLNQSYASHLQVMCPVDVDPTIVISMDPTTPQTFDNAYYKNLKQGMGLFTSDQVLYTDDRSKHLVESWAANSNAFNQAFIAAITKLGRVGVKNETNGDIRSDCSVLNPKKAS